MNVLFVCLGNICRSPMAAGIMRRIYKEESITGLVESAGTADWNLGQPADPRAIAIAREHGIDISAHRARQVCPADLSRFDRIFALDRQNENALRKMADAKTRHKISLLRGNAEVRDPYSGDEAVYREVYEIIEESCLEIAAQFSDSGET